jgi:outer membrane protein assembly factor BamB
MYGHDPSRTSYNPDETAIAADNLDRLAPRFQALVGMGDVPSSSGPVVAAGRACVGSSVPAGDNYLCFDSGSGQLLWSADIGHLSTSSSGNVGIGSTAAIAGGVVVVGGGDAAYYALDAGSGATLWRAPMDVGAIGFAWSSPLITDGLAYVGMSAQWTAVRGEVRALRLADGSTALRQYLVPETQVGADIWNSPALSPDGSLLAVATGNDAGGFDGPYTRAIVALAPDTLAIVDSHQEAPSNQDLDFGTTPLFFHDSANRALLGANHKNGSFYAYAVGGIGAGPVWQRATGTQVGAPAAYDPDVGAGGTLLIAGDNGVLFGVDPATGADRWPPVAVGRTNGTMAIANGLAFFNAGNLVIVDVATGAVRRTLNPVTAGPTYSGVAVSGGAVYWMAGPYLNAWGLS